MSGTLIAPWKEPFNHEVGLWTSTQPGHTKPVASLPQNHSAVAAACRLVIAGQLGILNSLPTSVILQALRNMQTSDGGTRHGCFRWFLEEPAPVDTNAAFFTGLNLIVLSIAFRDQLPAGDLPILDAMLEDLHLWFLRQCGDAELHYPNKFLGDLVCAWLLHEQVGGDEAEAASLEASLREAALYWKNEHWGWGEHLSDIYASVMLNELSSLLLLSQRLPDEIRHLYTELFHELVALEDAFAGGPRVPAIRTYAFTASPHVTTYRSTIRAWQNWEDVFSSHYHHFQFGHLFHQRGWHQLAGSPRPRGGQLDIPCYGGATARAWISDETRLGTLSRYPIMPWTDHATWGLSWQSMPVVLAAGENGWGFLRWHTREGGVDRYHPAHDKRLAYLSNALTDSVSPPITGRTSALQDGPDAIVLRLMPAVARAWEELSDQVVLFGSDWTVVSEVHRDETSRLVLRWRDSFLTIFSHSLGRGIHPILHQKEGSIVWEALWSQASLAGAEFVPFIWTFSWGREVDFPAEPEPVFRPGHRVRLPKGTWRISWPLPHETRQVDVDLGEDEPLTVVSPLSA